MEKRLKISSLISLILTLIAAGWLIFNSVMYELLKPLIINFEPLGNLAKLTNLIWIGCLFFLIYHIVVLLTYVYHLRLFRKINFFNILVLVSGIVSFFAVFSTITLLSDIGKEYKAGLDTSSEWILLYIFIIINSVFYILMFIFLLSAFRSIKLKGDIKPVKKDDMVFTVAQFVGIVCGILGLSWIFLNVIFNAKNTMHIKFYGMITCILLLLPYAMIVSYWILIQLRERIADWYDEKQWKDVSRAGLVTILISSLVMIIFFISTFNSLPGSVYGLIWLPFYLFSVLLIFSSCTLYFNRRT